MAEVPLLVPDASAILRHVFPHRALNRQANEMVADYQAGRVNLLAPFHFSIEVSSGIRRAVAKRELRHEQARELFLGFLANRIPLTDAPGLTETAFENCQRYSISMRDSLYVTLAQFYQAPLVTADENLLRAIARFPYKLFLSDYESPPRR